MYKYQYKYYYKHIYIFKTRFLGQSTLAVWKCPPTLDFIMERGMPSLHINDIGLHKDLLVGILVMVSLKGNLYSWGKTAVNQSKKWTRFIVNSFIAYKTKIWISTLPRYYYENYLDIFKSPIVIYRKVRHGTLTRGSISCIDVHKVPNSTYGDTHVTATDINFFVVKFPINSDAMTKTRDLIHSIIMGTWKYF